MGAIIAPAEFVLVFRGWHKRRVRVVLTSRSVNFGVFGVVGTANDNGDFGILISESDAISLSIAGCGCAFADETQDVFGFRVESGLIAVREDFNICVMLLAE